MKHWLPIYEKKRDFYVTLPCLIVGFYYIFMFLGINYSLPKDIANTSDYVSFLRDYTSSIFIVYAFVISYFFYGHTRKLLMKDMGTNTPFNDITTEITSGNKIKLNIIKTVEFVALGIFFFYLFYFQLGTTKWDHTYLRSQNIIVPIVYYIFMCFTFLFTALEYFYAWKSAFILHSFLENIKTDFKITNQDYFEMVKKFNIYDKDEFFGFKKCFDIIYSNITWGILIVIGVTCMYIASASMPEGLTVNIDLVSFLVIGISGSYYIPMFLYLFDLNRIVINIKLKFVHYYSEQIIEIEKNEAEMSENGYKKIQLISDRLNNVCNMNPPGVLVFSKYSVIVSIAISVITLVIQIYSNK